MRRRLLVTLMLLLPVAGFAQTKSPSIEGVWRITSAVITGANAANIPKAQPSMIIFTKSHYSWVSIGGTAARTDVPLPKDPNKPTDAEMRAFFGMWNPLTAQSGTYELKGDTLTRRPTVAKNVAVMTTNPPIVAQVKLEGNKLTLVARSMAGLPASETTMTLMRVE